VAVSSLRNVARPITGIHKEQVLEPVVVIIQKGNPAPHGFGKEFVAIGAVDVDEGDACGCRDVGEPRERDIIGRLGKGHRKKPSESQGQPHRLGFVWHFEQISIYMYPRSKLNDYR